jgi:PAS domain-containing protein/putative methionine-R-sulfoxide reductase with GAF domain
VKGDPEKGIRGFWADDRGVMESGEQKLYPKDPATIDGEVHVFNTLKTPLRDAAGNVWGVLAFARDVTERESILDSMENQQRTLQAVLDNMAAGVFMVEAPSGRPILSNKRAEDFLGRGISPQAVGDDLNQIYQAYKYGTDELYPPQDMPVVAGMFGATKTIDDMEVRRPDGSSILLQVNGSPVYNADGNIVASVVVFQDITERRKLEDTILQERARLAEAMGAAKMVSWEFDVASGCFIFSDDYYQFLGTTADQEGGYLMPAPVFSERFVHPDSAAETGMRIGAALTSPEPGYRAEFEARLIMKDGQPRTVVVSLQIQKDSQGNTVRLYGTNQDITERKLAEAIIAKRAAELATVAEVSTTVSTIQNPDEMLQTVVDLTRHSFELYHTHIYLLDENGEELVLTKGSGDVGRQMVTEGRRIALDTEKSLVARAARSQQGVTVNDVRQDPEFLPHPLLPETRSEMAVPMVATGRLLGVMDFQDVAVNRFSPEDINIMTTLSTQVAVSLQNARSYARAQRQAEREALINTISERIQATNSVESALQVAVREIGRALGANQAAIRLGLDRKSESQR